MKLLIATGLYPPDIGGPATYVRMLEEELPAHGIEMSVLPFATVRGYPKLVRHAVYAWKLWRMAKQADIVYALDPVSVGVPAAIVAKLRRLPFLLRLGGDYAWEQGRLRFGVDSLLDDFVATPQSSRPVRLLQWLQTWTARQAVRVVVPSQYLQRMVHHWHPSLASKTQVIYSALSPLQALDRASARAQLGFTGPAIVSAGRLVPWKGMLTVIKVVQQLQQDVPGIQLRIAGDGPERTVLEAYIAKHDLAEFVQLVGKLSKAELGMHKTAADVFVLNTAYEGFPHEILETMDLDTPVVTTNIGGNPELITDGVDGFLVAHDDQVALAAAIQQVLQSPEIARQVASSAQERAQAFSAASATESVVDLLQSVYEQRS